MNTGRRDLAGTGTLTAGLAFGGQSPTTAATEEYDGISWTAGGNMNNARNLLTRGGTQTAALAMGGQSPNFSAVEEYDGSSWTTSPATMATARSRLGGDGTSALALVYGGEGTATTAATEEFTNLINEVTSLDVS